MLARCRRTVFIFDSNDPGHAERHGLRGYLTRDGLSPEALRALARTDLARYPCVTLHEEAAADVRKLPDSFEVKAEDGRIERARLLLVATGRADALPELPGFAEYYGRGVYRCPYCDAWEHRGQPLAVHGNSVRAFEIARDLLTWSDQVAICCEGSPLWPGGKKRAAELGIVVIARKIRRLEGTPAGVTQVAFETGEPLPCGAIFFAGDDQRGSSLLDRLGCRFEHGQARHDARHAATNVPGLYVAGNARGGVHLSITAAAEGAEAAIEINEALLDRAYSSTAA